MQNQVDSSTTGHALDMLDGLTTATLIAIALFAVLVVVGIVYGAKLKRARTAARAEVEARNGTFTADQTPLSDAAATDVPPDGGPGEPSETTGQAQSQSQAQSEQEPATDPLPSPPPASPAPPPLDPPSASPGDPGDVALTTLKGLGPKIAEVLASQGVTRIGQLATLDEAQAAALDARLGAFSGRLYRDRWIEQARLLSAGDRAGYEAVFGRL